MAKLAVTRIHSTDDDCAHILPNGSHDPCQTMCMVVDVMEATYTPTNDKVTCHACQHELDVLKNGLVLKNV